MGNLRHLKWTDDAIKEKIFAVMDFHKIDRMPSRSEIISYGNSNGLLAKLSKVGFYKTAKKLGLEIKPSQTTTGKIHEKLARDLFVRKGFKVEQMSQNYPFDLLLNGVIKIDVKASNLHESSIGNYYSFAINKKVFTCDFYILLCLDNGVVTNRIYVIPAYRVSKNTQISIGIDRSKYTEYLNRFELLYKFEDSLIKIK